jgi:uncharacterized cupin superfamily protein
MSMSTPDPVPFDRNLPAPEPGAPDNVLSGQPRTLTQNLFTDPGEKFFSGIWASTKGRWRVDYAEHEFCQILSGKVVLTPDGGKPRTYKAGDAFVIPAGFHGTWETVEPVRKHYAIYLP